jgi:RNA polymerase sigma-70 factor, ECF subfamily
MGTLNLAMAMEAMPVSLPKGFQQIYEEHSGLVLRAALRVTGNMADAEDVLQTVFMRVLNQPDGLQAGVSQEAYLRRAATNAAIDVLRRRNTAREVDLEARQHSGKESTAYQKERVRQALAKLPKDDAELFVLRNIDGFSYDELAAMFGIERGTVASRLHRIREALRALIGE